MKNIFKFLFIIFIASCSESDDSSTGQDPEDPEQETKLLAFKKLENSNSTIPTEFVELNKTNGAETLLSNINNIDPIRSTVYYKNANQIFAIANREDQNGNYVSELVKIELADYSVSTFQLENLYFYNIILADNNRLLAFKKLENSDSTTPTELVELNKTNGTETLLSTVNNIDPIRSTVYDGNANQIFAIANREDQNGDYVNELVKIELADYSISTFQLENLQFYNIILADNNRLLAFKKLENSDSTIPTEFVELNKVNGTETLLFNINDIDPIRSTVYDDIDNEIFAIANREDQNGDYVNELVRIELSNLDVSTNQLESLQFYNIILQN